MGAEHLDQNASALFPASLVYCRVKQLLDWACALIALVILLPLLLAIALAIRLDSPGPALFWQERRGFQGTRFNILKFRTMRLQQPGQQTAEAVLVTSSDDPRITTIGRFLRRFRLDELPQLVNVLKGEMSWIGPRPEATALSNLYEKNLPFYGYRHIVRPGITGWAQVNQGHVASLEEVLNKLHYDLYYIKNLSFRLDAVIVFRTIKTMLTGFGAK
jgi:lipopolysaccharide/colanic/teichoic acid biosynthesis glycosyltransferase